MHPSVVGRVKLREGGCCAVCGLPIHGKGHLHHRLPRGIGGSAMLNTPANLVHLHETCHLRHVEQQRMRAYLNGWLVRRGSQPKDVPFMYMLDGWVLLNEDGTTTPATNPNENGDEK